MKLNQPYFIATTIGGNNMFAIMEVPGDEKPMQGEYKLSRGCVDANLKTGRFTDVTDRTDGAFGKVYVLTEEMGNN